MNELARVFLDDKARLVRYHKNQMAINAIEIGRHLAEAKAAVFKEKETDKGITWRSWVECECEIVLNQADTYIRVYNRFKNVIPDCGSNHSLGIAKLDLIAQLPNDTDINQFIEDHDIENKTVKDLARIIKETKGVEEIERKMIEEKAKAEGKIEAEKEYHSIFEESSIKIKNLESRENEYKREIKTLEEKEKYLRDELKKNNEAKDIADKIKKLKEQRNTLQEEIKEINELVDIKSNIKDMIKILSPVKYSALFHREQITNVTKRTIRELLDEVIAWVEDVENALEKQSKTYEV